MTQLPDGAIVITTATMYAEQRATHDAVIELTGTVKAMADNVRQERVDTARLIADHETRLRSVERKVWGLAGAATVLGAAAGVAASLVGH